MQWLSQNGKGEQNKRGGKRYSFENRLLKTLLKCLFSHVPHFYFSFRLAAFKVTVGMRGYTELSLADKQWTGARRSRQHQTPQWHFISPRCTDLPTLCILFSLFLWVKINGTNNVRSTPTQSFAQRWRHKCLHMQGHKTSSMRGIKNRPGKIIAGLAPLSLNALTVCLPTFGHLCWTHAGRQRGERSWRWNGGELHCSSAASPAGSTTN